MKKQILAVLLAAVLGLLCACGNAQESPTEAPTDATESQSAEAASSAGDYQQTQTIHMSETLCDGLTIDADIPVEEGLAVRTYHANYFQISSSDALSLLGGGSKIASEVPHYADPDGYTLTLDNGAEIFYAWGCLSYDSETEERDAQIAALLYNYAKNHSEEAVHELPFLSPEEAVSKAEDYIRALDIIGEPVLNSIIGLSGEEAMAWQSELMNNEEYISWIDLGKEAVLENVTSDDDAYYISFYFTYQDIPLFDYEREPTISVAGEDFIYYPSTEATVLLTPKGVRSFVVWNTLSAQGTASEAQSIISAQEALQKVCEKYENTITFGTSCITKVWLEYIPVQDVDAADGLGPYTLTPYWCFGKESEESSSGSMLSAVRINAITGDDLAYE